MAHKARVPERFQQSFDRGAVQRGVAADLRDGRNAAVLAIDGSKHFEPALESLYLPVFS